MGLDFEDHVAVITPLQSLNLSAHNDQPGSPHGRAEYCAAGMSDLLSPTRSFKFPGSGSGWTPPPTRRLPCRRAQ